MRGHCRSKAAAGRSDSSSSGLDGGSWFPARCCCNSMVCGWAPGSVGRAGCLYKQCSSVAGLHVDQQQARGSVGDAWGRGNAKSGDGGSHHHKWQGKLPVKQDYSKTGYIYV